MKLMLEPTPQIVVMDGAAARLWAGVDEEGVPVHAWICAVAPQTHDPVVVARYERELFLPEGCV